jgi:hypothetical protein
MKKSEFEKWFISQFGKCPISNTKGVNLENKLKGMEMEVGQIKRELKALQDWHANERAARYSWNARGKP